MNEMMREIKLLAAGEQGLVVEFGSVISPEINTAVRQLSQRMADAKTEGIVEIVPTYRSVMVWFDPLQITRQAVAERVRLLLEQVEIQTGRPASGRIVQVPVCYGGDFGPDLEFVAQHNHLSVEEVIAIHTSKPYLIYMLGFTPGFPYLGGMSETIATPRLKQPRVAIAAGSVGIAGSQTGVYPVESPGGWRLIGRTPLKVFEPESPTPFLFAAGDCLQFEPISAEEFLAIGRQVEAGTYQPAVRQP